MHLIPAQPITGAERLDRIKHALLQIGQALVFGVAFGECAQVSGDERADGGVLLGGVDARTTEHIIWDGHSNISHRITLSHLHTIS